MNNLKKRCMAVVSACLLIVGSAVPAFAAGETTHTVTANLMLPGELNTRLPGVTAYMTNGNNPLGEGGYEAKAPTEPVSNNATVTQSSDGTLTLTLPLPNPVFTLQSIGGSSNATITDTVRDSATYTSTDGKATREGRITQLTIKLNDRSGTYVFNNCVEFPTLLGVDWTVPLTLAVDLSGVPAPTEQQTTTSQSAASSSQSKPAAQSNTVTAAKTTTAAAINYDKLKAIITTVEKAEQEIPVSADGKDVSPSKTWVTQADMDTLKAALATARAAASAKEQSAVDAQTDALNKAYQTFVSAQQSGKGEATEHLGKTLKPGKYTISANIWFNKADTGLPLNPHITNSTFPPMNPVENNAELTIADDSTAQVVIPVCIKDRVMTVRELHGLTLLDTQKNEDGAITSITVDLGKLSGDSTVVTMQGEELTADIWMGDLAMTISGLDKEHTWPFTFELNLSGVDTTDGDKMPTVELEMLDSSAAAGAMAAAGVDADALDEEKEAEEEQAERQSGVQPFIAIIVIFAIFIGVPVVKKQMQKKKAQQAKEQNAKEESKHEN